MSSVEYEIDQGQDLMKLVEITKASIEPKCRATGARRMDLPADEQQAQRQRSAHDRPPSAAARRAIKNTLGLGNFEGWWRSSASSAARAVAGGAGFLAALKVWR